MLVILNLFIIVFYSPNKNESIPLTNIIFPIFEPRNPHKMISLLYVYVQNAKNQYSFKTLLFILKM